MDLAQWEEGEKKNPHRKPHTSAPQRNKQEIIMEDGAGKWKWNVRVHFPTRFCWGQLMYFWTVHGKSTWHNWIHFEIVNLRKVPNSQIDYKGKLMGLCLGFCLFVLIPTLREGKSDFTLKPNTHFKSVERGNSCESFSFVHYWKAFTYTILLKVM